MPVQETVGGHYMPHAAHRIDKRDKRPGRAFIPASISAAYRGYTRIVKKSKTFLFKQARRAAQDIPVAAHAEPGKIIFQRQPAEGAGFSAAGCPVLSASIMRSSVVRATVSTPAGQTVPQAPQ